jgi:RNA polymerase sigma-70 factor (ECF subfamily)
MGRGPGTGGLPVDAFVALVEQEGVAIHAYLARRAPQSAEDLLARAWLEAFAARTTYDPGLGAPRVWLFGVARQRAAVAASPACTAPARACALRSTSATDLFH